MINKEEDGTDKAILLPDKSIKVRSLITLMLMSYFIGKSNDLSRIFDYYIV